MTSTYSTLSADQAWALDWQVDQTSIPVGWPDIEPLLSAFDTTMVAEVKTKFHDLGYHETVKYFSSHFDEVDQRVAGMLGLADIYVQTPKTMAEYLLSMRPLMRKLERGESIADLKAKLTSGELELDDVIGLQRFYAKFNKQEPINQPNDTWLFMWQHQTELEAMLNPTYDQYHDYHSVTVMRRTYLTKSKLDGRIIESPQQVYLRVATQFYGDLTDATSVELVRQSYNMLAENLMVSASPTMFNAGLTKPQMASCFLQVLLDEMESISDSYKTTCTISQNNGASGVSISHLRSGTAIGNGGKSEGIRPVLKCLDDITGQVHQGRSKRPGATQCTINIFHVDVKLAIEMCSKTAVNDKRVENIQIVLNTCELFYDRAKNNQNWSLFCPHDTPMLNQTYGKDFKYWYEKYEQAGLAREVIPAVKLQDSYNIMRVRAGMPFITNRDTMCRKTNQQNIGNGIIESMNLCLEVVLKADRERIPSCILSSTRLPAFIKHENDQVSFDYNAMAKVVRQQVRNLNQLIKRNYYPIPEIAFSARESAFIGIGAQGFADVVAELDLCFEDPIATELAGKIASCIYYNAVHESMLMAKESGKTYPAFPGSPFSRGILQPDMWVAEAIEQGRTPPVIYEPSSWGQEGSYDELRQDVMTYGVANSELTTGQPTASTAQITRSNEAWEPFYYNLYVRKVLSGEYIQINHHLERDLRQLNLWIPAVKNFIRGNSGGSISGLTALLASTIKDTETIERLLYLERKYKTAFELKQKVILDHAIARGPYISGSQSTSLYFKVPDVKKIASAEFYAVDNGLKTICYYTRTETSQNAVNLSAVGEALAEKTLEIQQPPENTADVYGVETGVKLCLLEDPTCSSCA